MCHVYRHLFVDIITAHCQKQRKKQTHQIRIFDAIPKNVYCKLEIRRKYVMILAN